jgi:hypothetical protein
MNFQHNSLHSAFSSRSWLSGLGLAVGALLVAVPAQAASFSGFNFTTQVNPTNPDPKGDIWLKSVAIGGQTYSDFALVNRAIIQSNTATTGDQKGPGSSDKGDNASGIATELPTANQVVASLGNRNLNNIIDTEDKVGESIFDVFFDQSTTDFLFFERGLNSDLWVEALDGVGTVIAGSKTEITRNFWEKAGYSIDTTEINGAQQVGSRGLRFDTKISGLRISSFGVDDNGPDYKVVGVGKSLVNKVPEPAILLGLGLVAGSAFSRRRRVAQGALSV